jgi:hypothetical protein
MADVHPSLSVIVPCRGQLAQLRESAPALLADPAVQYVLVDVSCPDWSGNFARAYWPTATVVEVGNKGQFNQGSAFNAGARLTVGRWLAFLDPAVRVGASFSEAVRLSISDDVFLTGDRPGGPSPGLGPAWIVCAAAAFAQVGGFCEALTDGLSQKQELCRRLASMGLRRLALAPGALGLGSGVAGNSPSIRWPNPLTVGIVGPGFGDVFKTIQYAHHVRREFGLDVFLYPLWHGFRRVDFQQTPRGSRETLAREILDVLDVAWRLPLVTDTPVDQVYIPDRWPWHFHPLVPTRPRWRGSLQGPFHRITYQWDARSWPGLKNPSPEDSTCLLRFATGYEMVQLGKHLTVRECVEAAANSDLFVGVDSGMMQLCYAVGVPVFLLTYTMDSLVLFKWHGGHHAIHCAAALDFVVKAKQWLGLHS